MYLPKITATIQFIMIIVLVLLMVGSRDGVAMTIEEAIATALKNNPDIEMARAGVKKAEASVKKAKSLFMPNITFFSEYSGGNAPSAYLFKTIDQRELPAVIDFNDPGEFCNLETGLTARWNLFKGGRKLLGVSIAKIGVDNQEAFLEYQKNVIVSSLIHLYFSVLKSGEYAVIAKNSVDTVKEQLKIMTVRYEAGGVLKSDLLSLEVRLAEAKKALVEIENLHSATTTALAAILAREPDEKLNLSKECECPVQFPAGYEQAVSIALKKHPEMIRSQIRLEMAQKELKRAAAGYFPRLDFYAKYYGDSDNFEYREGNYTTALALNWDIFTGFSSPAEREEASQALAQAMAAKEKIRLKIYQEVKQAYLNYDDALQRLNVAERGVTMAEESLVLVKKRYEGGSVPITRYLETELARNRAEINLAAAFYDKKIAKSDIAGSMGILSQIWKEER